MSKKPMTTSQLTNAKAAAGLDRSDEELLLRYRSTGDESCFAQLVSRYERELYNYLRRFLGDAAMAEDVFQGAFLQLHLKCDQFKEGRKVRPWLYTIATNQAIDAQRRNRRHRLVSLDRQNGADGEEVGTLMDMLADGGPDPWTQLEAAEQRTWVQETVASLPEALRSSVVLVYFQGMKYREAADVLAIPVGTVKSRLHAAIVKISSAWRDRFGNEQSEDDAS
jgi:RNA polymerase sigma-70 factor (ECF subfamily)